MVFDIDITKFGNCLMKPKIFNVYQPGLGPSAFHIFVPVEIWNSAVDTAFGCFLLQFTFW